jgi:hypothetical protein
LNQYLTRQYWKGQRLLLLVFLLAHTVVAAIHISHQDLTFDEPDYYTYAVRWLQGKPERTNKMYDSKTPFTVVATIPRVVKQLLQPGYTATDNGVADMHAGRYFMVIYTILVALVLYKWIRHLFGPKAWIFPLLFFLFDPTVLSYSMIITSDMASGACLLATAYHLYLFYRTRRPRQFISFSVWLGLGLVCKASLLFFVPFLALFTAALMLAGQLRFNVLKLVKYTLLLAAIVIIVINLAYYGKDTFQPLQASEFRSAVFQKLSGSFLGAVPVPVPNSYIAGLDMLQYHGELGAGQPGSTYPGVFLHGEAKYKGGFWYYYLYTGLFKLPVAILVLVLAGLISAIVLLRRHFISTHAWYVFPLVFFFLVLSLLNPFQIGFRHILLIYPLLVMCIAAVLASGQRRYKWSGAVIMSLLAYMIVSLAATFPHLIAYTNELAFDKKNVFRELNDASIDYGQGRTALNDFLQKNPGIKRPTGAHTPGRYIVTASELFDHPVDPDHSWLNAYPPVAHFQYSMFIFDIRPQDIKKE